MKGKYMDHVSIKKRINDFKKAKKLTKVDNAMLDMEGHDPYQKSVVDLMHVELQGTIRRHLSQLLSTFSYSGIHIDFQDQVTAAGKKLDFTVKDIDANSSDNTLEFMVYSLKPIYDLLLDANSKVKKYKLQAKHERQ